MWGKAMKGKHNLKGPMFPSFETPPSPGYQKQQKPGRVLPMNSQYVSHSGRAARLRYLRQIAKPFLTSTDRRVQVAVERVRELTGGEPVPEYGMLQLICASKSTADSTGVPWIDSLEYIINRYNQMETANDFRPSDPESDERAPIE